MKFRYICGFCLIFSQVMFSNYSNAAIKDISGHWAESVITKWEQNGFVQGNEKGKFKPDDYITRAEFVTLVNKVIYGDVVVSDYNFTTFSDVLEKSWYYKDVMKGKYCGYINGYTDGSFKPLSTITREQVVNIVGRIYGIKTENENYSYVNQFVDGNKVNKVSLPYVNEFIKLGYMQGYSDNMLKPNGGMKRAEAVVFLDKLLDLKPKLTIANQNAESLYSQVRNEYIDISYSKDYTNEPLDIMVSVNDDTDILSIKYFNGKASIDDFYSDNCVDITDVSKFRVYKNGEYTVYVKNIDGKEVIRSFVVDNVYNGNIDVKFDYNTSDVMVVLPIKIDVVNLQDIVTIKWDYDVKDYDYFRTSGFDVTNEQTFDVLDNGLYTVYLKDKYGNELVKILAISNIDNVFLNSKLMYDNSITNKDIFVKIVESGDSVITKLKYIKGNAKIEDFENDGVDITLDKYFIVKDNGEYTIFTEDDLGNSEIKVININSIDKTNPLIEYSLLNAGITNLDKVNVKVSDDLGVKRLLIMKGECSAQDFDIEQSEDILQSRAFYAYENGKYTILAEDYAGNKSLKVIEIDNIDNVFPSIDVKYTSKAEDEVVKVVANDNRGISDVRFLKGRKGVSDFLNSGESILDSMSINIDGEGYYTVYVCDFAGNEKVKVFRIGNTDLESPIIKIEIDRDNIYDEWSYKANVNLSLEQLDYDVINFKWLEGNHKLEDFETEGNVVVDNTFQIESSIIEDTIFSVYVECKNGSKNVSLFNINNIDLDAPYVCYLKNGEYVNIDDLDSDDIDGIYIIDDASGIKYVKFALDDAELEDLEILEKGYVFIPIDKIKSGASYKLIMEDNVGNVSEANLKIG